MSQLHVAPEKDTKDHVVSFDEECWCKPQVLDEGANKTVIHKPTFPLVSGKKNRIEKVLLLEKGEQNLFVGTVNEVVVKE